MRISSSHTSSRRFPAHMPGYPNSRGSWKIHPSSKNYEKVCMDDADLRGQNLEGCWFSNASLANTNFGGATLTGADFRGANLRGADFRGANLQRCNFTDACLIGARFNRANITGSFGIAGDYIKGLEGAFWKAMHAPVFRYDDLHVITAYSGVYLLRYSPLRED